MTQRGNPGEQLAAGIPAHVLRSADTVNCPPLDLEVARMPNTKEYEYIAYPKLNHVKVGFVDITFRKPHIHREMEMGLVLDGQGLLTVNGTNIRIHRGSMYFVNANEAHDVIATSPTSIKVAFLQISNHFCQDYLHLFRNLEIQQNDLSGYFDEEREAYLRELLLNVLRTYLDNSDLSLLLCMESLLHLLRWVLQNVPYRYYDESQYRSMKRKMSRLTRIVEYIDMHYSEKIVLSDLARQEDISETYLSHFIRKNLNMSFQDYLNNLRLEKAIQLVLRGNMNLTDISLECGFSDVKYMNRMFQKQFGCLPREFNLSHRMENIQRSESAEDQLYASENVGQSWLDDFMNSAPEPGSESGAK